MNTTVLGLIIVVVFLYVIYVYNQIIRLNNQTQEAWSDIDVALKRRYALIPKLIDVVKGFAKHEKNLIEEVTNARVRAIEKKSIVEKDQADDLLQKALSRFLIVAENYPQLTSSQNFLELQKELTNTEDTIAYARRFYNGSVRDLNTKLDSFPNNLLSGLLQLKKREFFQLDLDKK